MHRPLSRKTGTRLAKARRAVRRAESVALRDENLAAIPPRHALV